MTAFIVDDERLARRELRQLLAEGHPEITVVGEAANAREALAQLAQLRPELLFRGARRKRSGSARRFDGCPTTNDAPFAAAHLPFGRRR